jgi:release factor glutamine methyltransferase
MTATVNDTLADALQRLAPTCATARVDAEALLMHVCGLGRAELITRAAEPIDAAVQTRLAALLARRERGEPVAYLTGVREFWSLDLTVTPATLIPRPETELLVERALALIPPDASLAVADLGTGCGAVALAVAHERPRTRIVATDRCGEALAVARSNAARLGIGNVAFCEGDWLAPLAGQRFEIIVSNPPYVRADDPHLSAGDVRFEPRAALVAGPDGLDAIRAIAVTAKGRLAPGGHLLFEHGHDQREPVRALLLEKGYRDIVCFRDLAGHDRVTACRAGT